MRAGFFLTLPWRGRVASHRASDVKRGGVKVYRRRWCLNGTASASRVP
ncbi:hypothetical protein ACVWY5_007298 [Bradyrhizobium sp. USDA 3256]